jgi:hypothetical protein
MFVGGIDRGYPLGGERVRCCSIPKPRTRTPGLLERLESRRLLSAITYYLSPSGNDSNSGTTPSLAWKTIARANTQSYHPGDALLLSGGSTFSGNLILTSADSGTAGSPISIGSYGTGWATISSGNTDGITVRDAGGISISNLNLVGSGPTVNTGAGIDLIDDQTSTTRLSYITINNVNVSGFGFVGIGIGSTTLTTGFSNVTITNSSLWNNALAGLFSYAGAYTTNPAPYGLAHSDIFVSHVTAYDNPGHSGQNDSGNGIELGNVDGATIENCTAYGNGAGNSSTSGGPVGIWTYNSNDVIIEGNESYSNTAAHSDGDGFDLDGGVTNSILQDNYTYNNAGAGILEAQFSGAQPSTGNMILNNICQNDGRRQVQAGIFLWCANSSDVINGTQICGNTIYMDASSTGSPCGILIDSYTKNVSIRNNLFEVAAGLQFQVVKSTGSNLVITGNDDVTGTALTIDSTWTGYEAQSIGVSWTGKGDGKTWNNAANWSDNAVPVGTDDVIIGSGVANIQVSAGSYAVRSLTALSPIEVRSGAAMTLYGQTYFADGLMIDNGGSVTLGGISTGGQQLLITSSLSVGSTGILDLANGAMDVQNGNLAAITTGIASGFSKGAWASQGITSSAARNDPKNLTALGVVLNNDGSGNSNYGIDSVLGLFAGYNPSPADVLVRYTYYGDTNLDGHVDQADYSMIDNGTLSHQTGWSNGDFNYDGVVDGSDYTLIDEAFNMQGASLAAAIAPSLKATVKSRPAPVKAAVLRLPAPSKKIPAKSVK